MMKLFFISMLFSIHLFAMEVDIKMLQKIVAEDKTALKERLILAKYYEENRNDLKALTLIEEVLEEDVKNKDALFLRKKIETRERYKNVFREASLSIPVVSSEAEKRLDSYYSANNYQFYSNLYQALVATDVTLQDSYHIKAAYIYLWDARYTQSKNALRQLRQENNIDAAKIRADICYYTGKYNCSARLYEKLYNSSYSKAIAIKLINSYINLGQMAKAERLYNFIYRKYPNNTELQKIGAQIKTSKDAYILNMKKAYEKKKTFQSLEAYTNALFSKGRKEEALSLIHEYNRKNATNNSLVLEAKYLVWAGETQSALEILEQSSLQKDLYAKFMLGQVYSWEGKFDISKKHLNEVIAQTQDKTLLFDAKKAFAFVRMWERKHKTAKEMFVALQKEKPRDAEVKEALMELNGDYIGLIKIYKKKGGSGA